MEMTASNNKSWKINMLEKLQVPVHKRYKKIYKKKLAENLP
jgi:hypothetical protein